MFKKTSAVQKSKSEYVAVFLFGVDFGNKCRHDCSVGSDYINDEFIMFAVEHLSKNRFEQNLWYRRRVELVTFFFGPWIKFIDC